MSKFDMELTATVELESGSKRRKFKGAVLELLDTLYDMDFSNVDYSTFYQTDRGRIKMSIESGRSYKREEAYEAVTGFIEDIRDANLDIQSLKQTTNSFEEQEDEG